jgi:hypothetical protein
VFDGGFTAASAADVCSTDLDISISDGLHQLLDASLIVTQPTDDHTRYRLYETVRQYAGERLTDAERADLELRHAHHFTDLAERAARELEGPEEQLWLARLDAERDNLRAALKTLLAHAPANALGLCFVLAPFWLRWIELEEGTRWFADALAAVPDRTEFRAEALLAAAAICIRSARNDRADEYAQESLAIAREGGDSVLEWRALHLLGASGVTREEPDIGIVWFERAIEVARQQGLAAPQALSVCCLGVALCWGPYSLENLVRGQELVEESVEQFAALAGSADRILAPLNITHTRAKSVAGLPPRFLLEDTVQPFVEVSLAQASAHAIMNLATIARMRGDLGRARSLLDAADDRFRRLSDERGQADVSVRLAYLELTEGATQAARSSLERALESRTRRYDRRGIGMALTGLGLVAVAAGEYERADRELTDARDLYRRSGDGWGLVSALWSTADLEIARGDLDAADAALDEALAVLKAHNDRLTAQTTTLLGATALLRGDTRRAQAMLRQARDLYASAHDDVSAAEVANRLEAITDPIRRAQQSDPHTS